MEGGQHHLTMKTFHFQLYIQCVVGAYFKLAYGAV